MFPDEEVGAVLVELYRLDYAEFDSEDPANARHFNADDEHPRDFETPHTYLDDLIADAVNARLMKSLGCELLLAWADGAGVSA